MFRFPEVPGSHLSWQASDEDKRLILHTLPSTVDPEADLPRQPPMSVTQQDASTATSVTPRLISVVEVIKREFIKNLENDHSPRLKGLYQYNEIVTLEELGIVVTSSANRDQEIPAETEETRRSEAILLALSGRHQSAYFIFLPYSQFTFSSLSKARDKHNPHFYGSPFRWLSFRI